MTLNGVVTDITTEDWHTVAAGFPGTITSITQYYKILTDGSIHAIEVDGKILVDASISNPDEVKILSTDVSAKTITVDGGKW